MEGVPRISMMSFPMRKSAESPNFRHKLKSFIRDHYTEDGESYSNEINELESLRAGAIHVSKDISGCSTLKKYLCQLNFLKSRFPLREGGLCAVRFSWHDVYSETVHGWSDIDFEMSCILYNIGALHSELGATDNRQSADGMKIACTHFQCAAWAFQHLRHNYEMFFTPDVSPDTLSIMTNICLAQAQECILEKSLIDNRKSSITAKVALQIVEYYQLALKTSDAMLKDASQYTDKVVKAIKKSRKLVELKSYYYSCISLLFRGLQSEGENKWGERITFYKGALEKLNEAVKCAKALDKTDNVHDTLQFTFDIVQGKVTISEKENEFVYHEKVLELNAVASDIKGVSLVKGIPFKFDDPQIAGPDIFGRLVPMEAHEASSLYSEEKAKLLRNYSSKIEAKNEALDKFVIALQLDQLELHSSSARNVPEELVECCASLSVNKDAVKRLSELMSRLSGLYYDVEGTLGELEQILSDEEKKEKECQAIIGQRPPSNVIMELTKEMQRYQSAHAVAADTNQTLHEALSKHVANLNILMKPFDEVLKYIPALEQEGDVNTEAISQMKRLIGKVDEMKRQRITLEQQLRDSIHSDDITKQLVIKKDQDLESVFQTELEKHDKITQILDQNLLAQENIIRALTEANANYAETRKATVHIIKRRQKFIEELLNSYETYDELLSKCNKGVEFYTKMDTNVQKLIQRVRGVCKVQDEERETSMKSLMNKGNVANSFVPSRSYTPHQVPLQSEPGTTGTCPPITTAPLKLKDYLEMKKDSHVSHSTLPAAAAVGGNATVNVQSPVQGPLSFSQPQQPYQPAASAQPQYQQNYQVPYQQQYYNMYQHQQPAVNNVADISHQQSKNSEYANESFLAKYVQQHQGHVPVSSNTGTIPNYLGFTSTPQCHSTNTSVYQQQPLSGYNKTVMSGGNATTHCASSVQHVQPATGIIHPQTSAFGMGNTPQPQQVTSVATNFTFQPESQQVMPNPNQQQSYYSGPPNLQGFNQQYYYSQLQPEARPPTQENNYNQHNQLQYVPHPSQSVYNSNSNGNGLCRTSNIDLLSEIDVNAPSVAPLTPIVAHIHAPTDRTE